MSESADAEEAVFCSWCCHSRQSSVPHKFQQRGHKGANGSGVSEQMMDFGWLGGHPRVLEFDTLQRSTDRRGVTKAFSRQRMTFRFAHMWNYRIIAYVALRQHIPQRAIHKQIGVTNMEGHSYHTNG